MKKFLLIALLLLPACADAQQNIFPSGPIFVLSNLVWGTVGTAIGFNNSWVFAPLNNGNSCLSVTVTNNNPTNNHTFRVFGFQTTVPTTTLTGPIIPPIGSGPNATWTQIFTSGGNSGSATAATAPAGAYNITGLVAGGVSQIVLNFDGGTTLAGSPDTANVIIVQTSGPCNLTQQNAPGVQPDFPGVSTGIANSEQASAVATAVSAVTPGATQFPSRGVLFSVNARCSAGTSSLSITDGATPIWSTAATEVSTTTFRFQWNPGLTSSVGRQLTITLASCGAGNTGTLDVQTSVVRVQQ
jgi:hypothetical protein